MKLYLDYETRSACDLKKAGSWNYAHDPSTQILCAAYAIDDGPVGLWQLGQDDTSSLSIPHRLGEYVCRGATVVGHNFAGFDSYLWETVWNLPPIPAAQIHDTMSLAYAMALPGSLEGAALALGLAHKKDMKANRVMLQLSQPRSRDPVVWWEPSDVPEKFEILHKYAMSDIEATREAYGRLLKLRPQEARIWALDYEINRRGVRVDLPAVHKAIAVVEREQLRLREEIQKVSRGAIATPQAVSQMGEWLKAKLNLDKKPSVDKKSVADALASVLPDDVRRVLEIRKEASKSSTAKFQAMAEAADPCDFRIRGAFAYCGAQATGRWAGRRVQLHNLKRGKSPEAVFQALMDDSLELLYASPISTLSDSLRGFIQAKEGFTFIGADFSSIEARVLAWLAGEEKVLKIFRGHGKIYEAAAADIFGIPLLEVSEDQRFVGKVAVLALGYQGGKRAFQKMAEAYGTQVSEERAEEIKIRWREAHPKIVRFWSRLENAAIQAIRNPDKKFQVDRITYLKKGSFLFCQLPSGRCITYPYAELKLVATPWGEKREQVHYKCQDSLTRKWDWTSGYGGLFAENVTQAVARDILAEAMLRISDRGWPISLHVHDEIVCETPEGGALELLDDFERGMTEVPPWAEGLPIAAKAWSGSRYNKG